MKPRQRETKQSYGIHLRHQEKCSSNKQKKICLKIFEDMPREYTKFHEFSLNLAGIQYENLPSAEFSRFSMIFFKNKIF